MFTRIGHFVVRHAWAVIAVWLVGATVVVALAPGLDDVTTGDQGAFVPDDTESARADRLAEQAFPETAATSAVLVFGRADGSPLTGADEQRVAEVAEQLSAAGIERVAGVATSPDALAPDGSIQLAQVALDGELTDTRVVAAVETLRENVTRLLAGTELEAGLTGEPAIVHDLEASFDDALVVVGIVTVVLIFGLLLAIFRSPIAGLLPVLTIGVVLVLASSLVAALYRALGLQSDPDLPILLTIVLFGVGTDYVLFLLFRYRERLRAGDAPEQAVATAVGRIGAVVSSAMLTTSAAFLVLLLASLGMFRTIGPAIAIGVALMALAALTLIPAVVTLLGRRVFWPSRSWQRTPEPRMARSVGRLVARRPLPAAVAAGSLLLGLAAAALSYTADYDMLATLPSDTEAVQAFEKLQEGFPAGALNPTEAYVRSDDGSPLTGDGLTRLVERLEAAEGVGQVLPAEVSDDGTAARIELLLDENPLSNAALDNVSGPLRETASAAAPEGTTVLLGGTSSTFADLREAYGRDMRVILPVAAALIVLVPAVLVRSLVAPWYIMVSVMATFGASLGVGVLVFQVAGGEAGMIWALPLLLYLFVIALGIDYSILMVARLREEFAAGTAPREAIARATERSVPVVIAAALILAGTFSALLTARVGFLTQLGVAVASGILLAAAMAIFLVPGLTALAGRAAWWPADGSGRPTDSPEPTAEEVATEPARSG